MDLRLKKIARPGSSAAFRFGSAELQERISAELQAWVPIHNLALSARGFLGPASWDYQTARDPRAGPPVVELEMVVHLQLKDNTIRASYDEWRKISEYYGSEYRLHPSITCRSHEMLETEKYATLTVFLHLTRAAQWLLAETLAGARGTVHFRYQPVGSAVPASSIYAYN